MTDDQKPKDLVGKTAAAQGTLSVHTHTYQPDKRLMKLITRLGGKMEVGQLLATLVAVVASVCVVAPKQIRVVLLNGCIKYLADIRDGFLKFEANEKETKQ